MSKYGPLADYLKRSKVATVTLTFAQIEQLVGPLPPSAQHGWWWANMPRAESQRSHAREWIGAGYRAHTPDFRAGTVTFEKQ